MDGNHMGGVESLLYGVIELRCMQARENITSHHSKRPYFLNIKKRLGHGIHCMVRGCISGTHSSQCSLSLLSFLLYLTKLDSLSKPSQIEEFLG